MTEIDVVRRPPGEPAPDLTDYRVVHRAMTVDLQRLTLTAAELVAQPDPVRMSALRHYLRGVFAEIESHHQVEDEYVWPLLVAVAGERAVVGPLTDDHDALDVLLRRVGRLVRSGPATAQLVTALREVTELLARHVAAEERDVFPLLEQLVRPADYRRLQRRFRVNLRLALMPFLLPWVFRHTTTNERRVLLGHAGWPVSVLLKIFEPGFRSREELLFG